MWICLWRRIISSIEKESEIFWGRGEVLLLRDRISTALFAWYHAAGLQVSDVPHYENTKHDIIWYRFTEISSQKMSWLITLATWKYAISDSRRPVVTMKVISAMVVALPCISPLRLQVASWKEHMDFLSIGGPLVVSYMKWSPVKRHLETPIRCQSSRSSTISPKRRFCIPWEWVKMWSSFSKDYWIRSQAVGLIGDKYLHRLGCPM